MSERSDSPRILLVCPTLPAPTGNGLSMRAALFLEGLATAHRVELVLAPVLDAPARGVRTLELPSEIDSRREVERLLSSPAGRERAARLYPRPRLCERLTLDASEQVAELARGCDLVHLMRLYLAPLADALLEQRPRPAITLDLDDLDADFYEQLGEFEEADAYRRMERHYLPRVEGACTAAPCDAKLLAERVPGARVSYLPNGVRMPPARGPGGVSTPPARGPGDPRYDLLFVGNLSYAPNIEAARWLCRELVPRVEGVSVALAGHRPDPSVSALARPGVSVIADPPAVGPLYARAALAVAPMPVRAGTSIKVLEALAHGLPVVASPAAAAGLPGDGVLVADGPDAFADACRSLLADPRRRSELGAAGRARVAAEHSTEVVTAAIGRWASFILAT